MFCAFINCCVMSAWIPVQFLVSPVTAVPVICYVCQGWVDPTEASPGLLPVSLSYIVTELATSCYASYSSKALVGYCRSIVVLTIRFIYLFAYQFHMCFMPRLFHSLDNSQHFGWRSGDIFTRVFTNEWKIAVSRHELCCCLAATCMSERWMPSYTGGRKNPWAWHSPSLVKYEMAYYWCQTKSGVVLVKEFAHRYLSLVVCYLQSLL